MGYSNSTRAVLRVKNFLDQMVASSGQIEWLSDEPNKLAYQLNDGLAVAKKRLKENPEFATYARLKDKYIIRVKKGKVVAEPRDVEPMEAVRAQLASKIVIEDVDDAMSVIGAAIKHQADELVFPDLELVYDELVLVYNWSSKNQYHVIPTGDGLMLSRTDENGLAWTPSESL